MYHRILLDPFKKPHTNKCQPCHGAADITPWMRCAAAATHSAFVSLALPDSSRAPGLAPLGYPILIQATRTVCRRSVLLIREIKVRGDRRGLLKWWLVCASTVYGGRVCGVLPQTTTPPPPSAAYPRVLRDMIPLRKCFRQYAPFSEHKYSFLLYLQPPSLLFVLCLHGSRMCTHALLLKTTGAVDQVILIRYRARSLPRLHRGSWVPAASYVGAKEKAKLILATCTWPALFGNLFTSLSEDTSS